MATSNPAREYSEECLLDAIHHAVTRNPGMSYEDLINGFQDGLRQAPKMFENAQPDEHQYREARSMQVQWEAQR